jgi:hypothetical protein
LDNGSSSKGGSFVKRLVGLGILFLVFIAVGFGCGDSEPTSQNEKAVSELEDAGQSPEQAREEVQRINKRVASMARREEAALERELREEGQGAATERREKAKHHGEAMKAACTLKGQRKADVTLEYTDEGFDFTFTGQPVPPSGTALYSATIFDKTGEYGVQLGVKFLDGEQIGYFVFSEDMVEQTNLDGEATVDSDTVSGSFPADSLGSLADAGPASWSAAINIEGTDVGLCPGGYNSMPFPG